MDFRSIFIFTLLISSILSFPTGCSENEWQCGDGTCVPKSARCDNFPDCNDGSDELRCTVSPVCLEGLESCPQPNGTTVCVKKAIGCGCGMVPNISNGDIVASSNLIGSVANVTCDAGYQPDVSLIICQKTGLWETASCDPRDCGPVSKIAFGIINLGDKNNTSFGAMGFVSCDVGYKTVTPNITCLENGNWSTAVCSRKDCGSPPEISFGNITLHNNSISTVGAKASVTCVDNHTPSKTTIECNSSGVWDQVSCVLSGCGSVPIINHGTIKSSGNTTFGSLAEVNCNVGYRTSLPTVSCLTTGDWEVAECLPIDCGSPPDILYGNITLHNNSIAMVGATASVICANNYAPSKPTITCNTSGVWENVSCDLTGCGSVPTISHGTIKTSGNTTFGSFAKVECDVGYRASMITVSCKTTGDWEMVECLPIDCGSPPVISFGNITLYNNSLSTVGATASVTCINNYTPSKPMLTCNASGVWEQVSCDLTGCGSVPSIIHGTIKSSGNTTFGSFAKVECDVGYRASMITASCKTTGDWEVAECLPIDCGSPPDVQYGNITLQNKNVSIVGSTASVSCIDNYAPSKQMVTCNTSGVWEQVSCDLTGCGNLPTIIHGTLKPTEKTIFGSFAEVLCEVGYKTNKSFIQCQRSGHWEMSSCEPIDCGLPPYLPNGRTRIFNNQTTYGARASVECNNKYTSNIRYIKCLATGEWENAKCIPKGNNSRDRCTDEHGVCTQHIYKNVRLVALKSTKCRTFCQCVHAGTSVGGLITYKWAEHRCPAGTLFDDKLISRVCNHQFLVSC